MQTLVNELKGCAHAKLEDIPFNYVIKNGIPELIRTSSAATAGPSGPSNYAMPYQGL